MSLFKQLYNKYFLIPVHETEKSPLVSLNNYKGKKIPLQKFKHDRCGIICGYDGLEIIDIDNKLDNADYHYQLIKDHCNVDNMAHVATQSGGYHIYYKCPGHSFPAQKLAQKWDGEKVNKKTGNQIPETLIETRGQNTYAVCPPTKGYDLISGDILNLPRISLEERNFIIDFCKAQNEFIPKSQQIKGDSCVNTNADLNYHGEKSGDKFNREGINDCISLLKNHGWKTSNNVEWTRPGKKKGVSATLGRVKSANGNLLMHVFTSSSELQDENYTLFGLYTTLEHNGDYKASAKALGDKYGIKPAKPAKPSKVASKEINKSELDILKYIRVGNSYFKKVNSSLIRWSRQNLIDDHKKDALIGIPKYDQFVNEPSHIDYKPIINGIFYNKYSAPCVFPSEEYGDFQTIKVLLKHLFNVQLDIILDWIQISYVNPLQRLPVICLVGEKNETGKSGFGRLMSYIYGDNYASIKLTEYRSEFNSTYIDKNVVSIEEGKMNVEEVEKLKKDSTDDTAFLREMHVDRVKINHFAKYIVTSNRAADFIKVTKNDNRFWIKNVLAFPDENFDPLFDDKIKAEVPFFLNYLMTRELHVKEKEGRFWIGHERYIGDEFARVLINSRADEINELYYTILDDLDNNNKKMICGSSVLLKKWFCDSYKMNSSVIQKAIVEDFPDIVLTKGRYDKYGGEMSKIYNGTYYTITSDMLKKVLGMDYELEYEEDEMPF